MKKKFPRGSQLLRDSFLNKGTAFTQKEREQFGLLGLLPPRVNSVENQVMRVMANIQSKTSALEKYVYLLTLQERNKTLFYRVLMDRLEDIMPIVYTPTVGQACLEHGHIFRSSSQGLFLAAEQMKRFEEILRNWPHKDVRVIVVTDGERILGLGDLGVDGIGIPVGKLTLYTGCAGVHPKYCLPITLDVGTNNTNLLKDPFYIGMAHPRLRGKKYDNVIERFMSAVRNVFPRALVQFEDFATHNAFRLLEKYRTRACVFNDDIQGTAAVGLAGIYSAMRMTGAKLRDQKILFVGAGEAGLGMANLVKTALMQEGLCEKEAKEHCLLLDSKGLVVSSRNDLSEGKRAFAYEGRFASDCLSAIQSLKPNILIGSSGQHGIFTRDALKAMARNNKQPIVFAMSNPTSAAECTAQEAYMYTQGRVIFASGSPFPPVNYRKNTFTPGQSNNVYIFPGLGLGIVTCRIKQVTDEMFFVAAKTLASMACEEDFMCGRVYPSFKRIREVSLAIAEAVATVAYAQGFAAQPKPKNLKAYIKSQMYNPVYLEYFS